MRLPRLILDPEACAYHCIARTVDQKWFFDTPARRDHIQKIIQASAILKGANLLNFVVMSARSNKESIISQTIDKSHCS